MLNTWDEENDLIMTNAAEQYLLEISKEDSIYGLEFFVSPLCNQRCEYCYLIKQGEKLYPKDIRDKNTILKNLDIFLNYLTEKNTIPKRIDLFSGEIWESTLGFQILQKLLNFSKLHPEKIETITIPSNFSFLRNETARITIEKLISAFQFYGTILVFSCSYDGPVIEEINRPLVNKNNQEKITENYIKQLFTWCKKYNYGFHPMVNAYSIEKWPEQYKWWLDMFKEYDLPLYNFSMFLEVRNNEWTKEKIISYLKYLNFAMDYTIKIAHNDDIENYVYHSLVGAKDDPQKQLSCLENYNFQAFGFSNKNNGCSVDRMMCIRLGDLAWAPCHRTSYEKLLYGKFKIKNNKIIGVKALNIPIFVGINALSYKGHLKCDICNLAPVCMRGCYGAQIESSKEIFYPCETVCDLNFAKWLFLKEKYKQIYFNNNNFDPKKELIDFYENLCNIIDKTPKEIKEIWMPIISQILSMN